MMIAMECIDKFLCLATVSHHMKQEAMGNIFKKGPEEHSTQKSEDDPRCGIMQGIAAIKQHISYHGQIHAPNHQGMGFGKHFKKIIPEKPCLSLIVNLFKLHIAKIGKSPIEPAD